MKHEKQILKEVRWALWLTLIYILGWAGLAYFVPSGRGILGFPLWFELSCLYLPLLFILLLSVVIKRFFQNIAFEE